jgi:hypothetical protein
MCRKINKVGKQKVGIWWVQKRFPRYGVFICPYRGKRFWTHQIPTSCLPTLLIFMHIEHICTFFVTFFSATIDDRDLIFGHKLHIGTPYRGKRFWTHQIPTFCLPTLLIFLHIEHICSFLSHSRNLMGPKTLPTIWHSYMKLVTKYQIPVINSCWEKCDEKYAYMFNVYKNQQNRQTGSRSSQFILFV